MRGTKYTGKYGGLLYLFFLILILSAASCGDGITLSSENEIAAFSIGASDLNGESSVQIDGTNIRISVPFGTNLSRLAPEISIPEGAVIEPESGSVQDFSRPVSYTVTAEDGSKVVYQVTAGMQANRLSELFSVRLAGRFEEPEIQGMNIIFTLPYGCSEDQTPVFEISENACSLPACEETINFAEPVHYLVTAEDQNFKSVYTIIINYLPNTAADLFDVYLDDGIVPNSSEGGKFTFAMAEGDSPRRTLNFSLSDQATSNSQSGMLVDLTEPVSIEVTSGSGAIRSYSFEIEYR